MSIHAVPVACTGCLPPLCSWEILWVYPARIPVSSLSIPPPKHPVALQIMFCRLFFFSSNIWTYIFYGDADGQQHLPLPASSCTLIWIVITSSGCDLCPVFAHYLFLSGLHLLQTTHYVLIIVKSPLHQAGLSSARRALLVPAAAKEDAACNDALITCLLDTGPDHLFVSNKLF